LAGLAARRADELVILMRAYVEKPRTALGWRGLVTDPGLDGSHRWEDGLVVARALLRDIAALGLPLACEFLDPLAVPYLVDLVSWGCIGARTTESQVHRQLASGLALPVGFKNPTGGNVQAAVDAVRAVARPQVLLGIGDDGRACAGVTGGNPDAHVVLRGGTAGPNADRAGVADALRRLDRAGLVPAVVVDASHGNSERDHRRQPRVAADIGERLAAGEPGLAGVMLESFLVAGRQDPDGVAPAHLVYGQSVTDACMGWTTTVEVVDGLARAVDRRRQAGQAVGVHGSIHGEAGHPSAADMMEKAVAPSMDWRMTSA
jgi:3-deoxy-7-phosphoheptulonate synthase